MPWHKWRRQQPEWCWRRRSRPMDFPTSPGLVHRCGLPAMQVASNAGAERAHLGRPLRDN
eukprot:13478550-Alexandrium_andersonii.AAC.1